LIHDNERKKKCLLSDLEAYNIERITSTTDTDKFCKAICAFANDMPGKGETGYMFIGVEDKTGKISGIEVTDQLLRNMASHRDSGQIIPLPSVSVKKESFPEGDIAVVEVRPSDMPPVRYKGRILIRVGPRQAIASEQEERILNERRVYSAKTFDMMPCIGCGEDMIVHSLFYDYRNSAFAPEIIEENNRDMLTLLRELDAFLKTLFPSRPVPVSTLREEQRYLFPNRAVRELLMNAVMHRDYQSNAPIRFYWFSDRIEIQNPGGLYGAATDFHHQNDYRNPKIAEAMKVLGYVNQFGRGIATVQSSLEKNGNPPAQFIVDSPKYFLAIVKEISS
jgi:ATP-dependent DNA helicase RecG